MFLVACSSVLFSLMSLLVKILSRDYQIKPFQMVFMRAVINGSINVTSLLLKGGHVRELLGPKSVRRFLVARGCFGLVGLSGSYSGECEKKA
jgi:drug/metabolite transporter (DMT)-like permease